MMIQGETVLYGAELPFNGATPEVMSTPAGYYIGYTDVFGLPYSRETYYMSEEQAIASFEDGSWMKHRRK
jgi:hypothetical protein